MHLVHDGRLKPRYNYLNPLLDEMGSLIQKRSFEELGDWEYYPTMVNTYITPGA